MKRCKNSKRYKGIMYPSCNSGDPCETCLSKWRERHSRVAYVDGHPYLGSITPVMDKIEEMKSRFVASEKEISDLLNMRPSPLDSYFLGVADKHGLDLFDTEGEE